MNIESTIQRQFTTTIRSNVSIREYLAELAQSSYSSFLVVDDGNVHRLYGSLLSEIFANDSRYCISILPAGEQSKTFLHYQTLCNFAVERKIERSGLVIAFGGGVVSDLAGLVAATVLRGIPWVAIPTTIIGAVDAAIGGKTGINLPLAKNFLGTIYPAKEVTVDITVLSTLPERELQSGWGEIVKYGMLVGGELWKEIAERQFTSIPPATVCERCIETKVAIVERDPFEYGERKLLNLGHTAGHALEASCGFKQLRHGEAVAWGLGVVADISRELHRLPEDEYKSIQSVLKKFHLPWVSASQTDVLHRLQFDKKRVNKKNEWILLEKIGKPVITNNVPQALVERVVAERISILLEGRVA